MDERTVRALVTLVCVSVVGCAAVTPPGSPVNQQGPVQPAPRPASAKGLIAYNVANTVGGVDLWLVDPVLGATNPVEVQLADAEFPAWSRDGSRIAVTGPLPPSAQDIYTVHPDGSDLRRETTLPRPIEPAPPEAEPGAEPPDFSTTRLDPDFKAWSPDGQRMAYNAVAQERGLMVGRVHTVGTGSEQDVNVAATQLSGFTGFGIDWSPRADITTSPLQMLLTFTDQVTGAAIFANVTTIVASPPVANVAATGQIWRQTTPFAAEPDQQMDLWPSFSSDGSLIAFARTTVPGLGGQIDTRLMIVPLTEDHRVRCSDLGCADLANPTGERTVIDLPGEVIIGTSWSGDGTRLAFSSVATSDISNLGLLSLAPTGAGASLWLVGIDGSGLRRIASPGASPSWDWSR